MAEEQPNQEQENEEEAQPKKSRKLLIVIVAVVLLGGLGGGYFFWQRSAAATPETEEAAETQPATEIGSFISLETFIVNLAGGDGRDFLRIGIELGVGGDADSDLAGAGGAPVPQIRDTILEVLTTLESEELLTAEGKQQLESDLLQALEERLGHLNVQEVYFDEFLVQR